MRSRVTHLSQVLSSGRVRLWAVAENLHHEESQRSEVRGQGAAYTAVHCQMKPAQPDSSILTCSLLTPPSDSSWPRPLLRGGLMSLWRHLLDRRWNNWWLLLSEELRTEINKWSMISSVIDYRTKTISYWSITSDLFSTLVSQLLCEAQFYLHNELSKQLGLVGKQRGRGSVGDLWPQDTRKYKWVNEQ